MTLTDFLLERIAEDKADVLDPAALLHFSPERVLAECEAKRRIVEQFRAWDKAGIRMVAMAIGSAVRHLAAIYADHPDYREEWKPLT